MRGTLSEMDKEPTQTTGQGFEIPVSTEGEVLDAFRKVAGAKRDEDAENRDSESE